MMTRMERAMVQTNEQPCTTEKPLTARVDLKPTNRNKKMSHFYRFGTRGATGHFALVSGYRPSGKDGSLPIEWERAMLQDEIPLEPPWPHCKMLRAPLMPPGYEQEYNGYKLKPGVEFPDICSAGDRALVSARAKAVLEACDDFGHEYIETEVQDESRQRINQTPYYLLSVRRILKIDELGPYGAIENQYKMFHPNYYEKKFLPVVQQSPELKDRLSQLPLWRQFGNWGVIYLSETVLNALRDAGITGLDPYTTYFGEPGEALGRFE